MEKVFTMNDGKGLLFGPGLAASGVPARAWFSGVTLWVEHEGGRLSASTERLTARLGGFDGRQRSLEWQTGNGLVSLQLPDSPETDAWLAGAPAPLRVHFGALGRARTRRFGFGAGLIAAVLLLPFVLLGLFWLNADRIAGWAAGHVSLAQEQQLGDLAFAQMRPSLKLVESGPAPEMVRAIGARLTAGSHYRYQWFVADSPEVNAFAMPGGYVVVYTGLIKAADSAEEVAGVLAHEVQHVELRHSLKNLIHGLGWRAVLALALGDLSGGVWAGMAEQLGGMAYGRDLERQADLEGLKALKRAGIAPQGMLSFFAKLAKQEGPGLALLSSHPATEERMDNLRRAIAEQGDYAARPLPYVLDSLGDLSPP
jgi:Zn-dependent protease with chaperone function